MRILFILKRKRIGIPSFFETADIRIIMRLGPSVSIVLDDGLFIRHLARLQSEPTRNDNKMQTRTDLSVIFAPLQNDPNPTLFYSRKKQIGLNQCQKGIVQGQDNQWRTRYEHHYR